MTVKHAIFDLDGTLTDSNGVWFDAVFYYIDKYCDYTRADLPPEFESEIIFGGTYEALDFLKRTMGERRTPDESRALIMSAVAELYKKGNDEKPGAGEYLRMLKNSGADVCVVTATPSDLAETALEKAGLLQYTDFILSGEERKSGKEKPYIFLEAAARMNCTAAECTLFEDALYSIRTGKELGMTVVGVHDSFCTEEARAQIKELCDIYITDYSQLHI